MHGADSRTVKLIIRLLRVQHHGYVLRLPLHGNEREYAARPGVVFPGTPRTDIRSQ